MLIVDGREVACKAVVLDWFAMRMAFRKLGRRTKTTKIVLHWTGGTGDAFRVHDTLLERGLSVHFCVDKTGDVYQFCDANAVCSHAGRLDDGFTSANVDTIGIEIINRATVDLAPGSDDGRSSVTDSIHGRSVSYAGYYPEQIEAVRHLCESLCKAYNLPMAVPMSPDKFGGEPKLVTRALSTARWHAHRGLVGHYHARSTKLDPGPSLLKRLTQP